MISAQRFPGDFDGIAVGAPVLNFTDIMIWNLWNARALEAAPVPIDKMSLVADAAYRKCDAKRIVPYVGWADTALTPLMSVGYYEQVTAKMGPSTRDFYRLFMVPGMFHCRGGIGTDRVNALTALINWVENGAPPERIVATRLEDGKLARSRPLYPYPQTARYAGSGSVDEAASFACTTP